jgi:hypothetical protein
MHKKDHNLVFEEKRQFLPPKIAKKSDHTVDPGVRWFSACMHARRECPLFQKAQKRV